MMCSGESGGRICTRLEGFAVCQLTLLRQKDQLGQRRDCKRSKPEALGSTQSTTKTRRSDGTSLLGLGLSPSIPSLLTSCVTL